MLSILPDAHQTTVLLIKQSTAAIPNSYGTPSTPNPKATADQTPRPSLDPHCTTREYQIRRFIAAVRAESFGVRAPHAQVTIILFHLAPLDGSATSLFSWLSLQTRKTET